MNTKRREFTLDPRLKKHQFSEFKPSLKKKLPTFTNEMSEKAKLQIFQIVLLTEGMKIFHYLSRSTEKTLIEVLVKFQNKAQKMNSN